MLIVFGHRKRTGKDRAAGFLAEQLLGKRMPNGSPVPVLQLSLATPLKEAVRTLYPAVGAAHEYEDGGSRDKDAIIPEYGKSARALWLDYGKLINDYDTDCFTRAALSHVRPAGYYLIRDLRRRVEADAIHALHPDAVFIRMDRVVLPDPTAYKLDDELADWQGWNYIIDNRADNLPGLYTAMGILASGFKRGLAKGPGSMSTITIDPILSKIVD